MSSSKTTNNKWSLSNHNQTHLTKAYKKYTQTRPENPITSLIRRTSILILEWVDELKEKQKVKLVG
jgi:hypothetical protein